MKLNFDEAWDDTVTLVRSNFGLLATIAGVLIFLPSVFVTIIFPDANMEALFESAVASSELDKEKLQAAILAVFREYWWIFLASILLTYLAYLAMTALLRRHTSPTVGEALGEGIRFLPSYIGASLLQGFVTGIAAFIPVFLFGALSALLGVEAIITIGVLFAFPIIIYMSIKFSLVLPVIGIDGELNPIKALSKSWRITKGNSLRLFGFFLLLVIAGFVLALLVSLAFGLLFALGGEQVIEFGGTLISGLIGILNAIIFVSVLAAIHAQLSRNDVVAETIPES